MSRLRLAVLILPLLTAACGDDTPTTPTPPSLGIPFTITELVVGTGNVALNGRRVVVHYTGWLYDPAAGDNDFKGVRFDSSLDENREPLVLILGGGGFIQGFGPGISGMRVGGLRRVIIPPELGYGLVGNGTVIPPNATLIFELELLSAI